MNKVLLIIKNILLFLLIFLVIKYTIVFNVIGLENVVFLALLFIYLWLDIVDTFKRRDIRFNKTYNIISIVMLFIMIFVFARTLYDQNFLYNANKYKDLLVKSNDISLDDVIYYNISYLFQNLRCFILMIALILIYRKINIGKINIKYHWLSVACFVLSILSVPLSLSILSSTQLEIVYILFTIALIGVEFYRLFKDNHKYRNWPIFVSFIFNTLAIISIVINIIINVF